MDLSETPPMATTLAGPSNVDRRVSLSSSSKLSPDEKQKHWDVKEFLTLKTPWSQDRWMTACRLLFQSDGKSIEHVELIKILLDPTQDLDHQQRVFLNRSALESIDLRGWAPCMGIFTILMEQAYHSKDPELVEAYLKRCIHLHDLDGVSRIDFARAVAAWYAAGNHNAPRIISLIEEWWLPMFRRRPCFYLAPLSESYSMCFGALCATGQHEIARDMLKRVRSLRQQDNFWPNADMYNPIMSFYGKIGNVAEVESIFMEMVNDYRTGRNAHCIPNIFSFGILMQAVNKHGKASDAPVTNEKLLDLLLQFRHHFSNTSKLEPSAYLYSIAIDTWAKCTTNKDAPFRATNIFRRMEKDGVAPTMHCYNAVLNAWARACKTDPEAAQQLEMLWAEFKGAAEHNTFVPTRHAYLARIDAWERSQRIPTKKARYIESMPMNTNAAFMALKALKEMNADTSLEPWSEGVPTKAMMYSRTILTFSRIGNFKEMERLLNEMMSSDHPDFAPTDSTLSFCLKAYQVCEVPDAGEKAELVFNRLAPISNINCVSMNSLLACWRVSTSEKAPERALYWLERMKSEYSILPDIISYSEVLRSILRSKHHSDAQKTEWVRLVLSNIEAAGKKIDCDRNLVHRYAKACADGKELPLPETVP